MIRRRSLRLRMMVLFCAVVGLLFAASYTGFYLVFRRFIRDQLDLMLRESAAPIVADLMIDPRDKDVDELNIDGEYFEVLDSAGVVLLRSANLRAPLHLSFGATNEPLPLQTIVTAGNGELRVAIVPFMAGPQRWFLVAAAPTAGMKSSLRILLDSSVAVLLFSLLLTAGISWFYTKRSLRPVTELTREAAEMYAQLSRPAGAAQEPKSANYPDDELYVLAATLNRLFGRLNQVLQQLRQFVSDASHEMRTPLSILRGETELLLARSRTPAEYERALHIIDSEIKRLSHIVDGLFTLAMADAGELRLAFEPLYLEEVVQETCASVKSLAERNCVRIELDLQNEVCIEGDPAFLRQLFLILIDNALKYSPSNTRLLVTLRAASEARIQIQDQGIGISPEHLPRIFERFFRVSQTGSGETHSGGLGLSIARAIVQAHGGIIECESELGTGSVFTIRLPLRQS